MDTTTSSNLSTSPATTPGSSMCVQAYTSQFIKEGLRIKMRQKMGSGGNESAGSTQGNNGDELPCIALLALAESKCTVISMAI